jgi:hypothetical protein
MIWRVVRYFLQFPIWGDEALLAINFARLDYGELAQRLENCQIAPILFLWGERAAYEWLGPSELAMRLLPFLAGMLSLVLYWRLTGLVLDPLPRVFAVGFLAVAIWPVSMSTLLKPYSCDLLMTLVLLVSATQWLRAPQQWRWLAALALLAPVCLLGSYPVAFVAGGVSLTLLVPAWRQGWAARCWFGIYNLTMGAGFLVACWIGDRQLGTVTSGVDTATGMGAYWASSFCPATLLAFPKWFLLQTTGQLTAYPVGAASGGSVLTATLSLMGSLCLVRRSQWTLLILCCAPLVLNLLAAAMHRYPYGGSCRLSQHLAAGICLLAGLGLANLIEKDWRCPARQLKWVVACTGLFVIVGLAGVLRDYLFPYRDAGYVWMRDTMSEMRALIPTGDPVVICGGPQETEAVFVWYWLSQGGRVTWEYQLPARHECPRLWGFHQGPAADEACRRLTDIVQRQDPKRLLVARLPFDYEARNHHAVSQHCELFCFKVDGPACPTDRQVQE